MSYSKKKVLVTGHTGFKGSWLCLWLKELGAEVLGYALPPPTDPSHFELLKLDVDSIIGDIRDSDKLFDVMEEFNPEIVFHLAAQPLVRYSYWEPYETFETNIMGTINLLETCRNISSVKAIVNVTSDKCYSNQEWCWGYRESDPMGGYDPYSASKGCVELITSSYRNSFFNLKDFGQTHNVLLASVRAGNVIGGGDWAEDRLMPDIIKNVSSKRKVIIRNPESVRPWQHVLEPLSGYLMLGKKLLNGEREYADGWNFGPSDEGIVSVQGILEQVKGLWPQCEYEIVKAPNQPHECEMLKLDSSKAHLRLKWKSVWSNEIAFRKTIEWYREFYENGVINSLADLKDYMKTAENKNPPWRKM